MPECLIADGYTLAGTFKGFGPWPTVKFRYRPALPTRVFAYIAADKSDAEGRMRAIEDLLAGNAERPGQLVSWDITEKGQPAPITPANLRRVPDPILARLIEAVTGYSSEEQETDAKNSDTGSPSS